MIKPYKEIQMSITRCLDCERRIDIDIEDAHYVNDSECLCEDCYYDDEVIATMVIGDEKYYKTSYRLFNKYGDDDVPEVIKNYANSVKYHSTNGWRGYYEGEIPSGYNLVKSKWFCGMDGHNMDDFMLNLNDILDNNPERLSGFDYFVVVLPTTNVFSQNLEVYVNNSQKDKFIEEIK
tara:strand:+ start:67 stop:600 length:534 start_codon:yes stop_codon:yes gene_type:complete